MARADEERVSRRLHVAVLVAVPLLVLSVVVAAWAGPFWVARGRELLERQRWPEQRAQVLDAVAAVTLPAAYVEEPCASADDPADRCWRVDLAPEETTAALAEALTAAGVAAVRPGLAPVEGAGTIALARGTVAGREVGLFATTEVDEEATVAAGAVVLRPGALVRSTADLEAP